MISPQEQLLIIKKGVHMMVDEDELLAKLEKSVATNKPLNIKLGLDPSAPDIHLGHSVVLRKMRQMQDLGHNITIIIGDFTGKIGDPSGKAKGRNALTEEQVQANAKTYCDQIFKILDIDKTEVVRNSEWLAKLTFEDVVRLAGKTTVARILERDDFKSRYENQTPIGLHEFFYPLMQGYDSVHLKADVELGGTDQTFNILFGRTMQKSFDMEAQIAIFMPLLEGLDGKEKMSKSLGNYIGIDEPAEVMFKKTMEVPDELIIRYFELVTDVHPREVDAIKAELEAGANPRDIKLRLAETITSLYHCPEDVEKAKKFFETAFSKKEIPDEIPQIKIGKPSITLMELSELLIKEGFVPSKSELIRLVNQSGVQLNEEKISTTDIELKSGDNLRIGKKKFVQIVE